MYGISWNIEKQMESSVIRYLVSKCNGNAFSMEYPTAEMESLGIKPWPGNSEINQIQNGNGEDMLIVNLTGSMIYSTVERDYKIETLASLEPFCLDILTKKYDQDKDDIMRSVLSQNDFIF